MIARLPIPSPGRPAAEAFVAANLGHLVSDDVAGSPSIRGGQSAANAALAAFDVTGYARRRNEVHPPHRRGASQLSPYIRHGLLQLPEVWRHVAVGPARDVQKYRDELLWQEFARHWYARLGRATKKGVRRELLPTNLATEWDRSMACIGLVTTELEGDGWLVNQTRMWLASEWAIRQGGDWRAGEDYFFRHLLDGSRAANRLGWQWTTGTGSSKHYGFSRWQVNKRAPGLCSTCPHQYACPIEEWPDNPELTPTQVPTQIKSLRDVELVHGPTVATGGESPTTVWLTAESLGDDDPALVAHPELPAVFVFDESLLAGLRLSSKRLVFLTETLAQLATVRDLTISLGDPATVLGDEPVAVTFAPVPGFRTKLAALTRPRVHPWPWLVPPANGSVASFSAWRKSATRSI